MHSEEMEDIEEAGAGEIVAMFGVDCSSGDTFTDGSLNYGMETMFCPEPVISYAVRPTSTKQSQNFSKALNRFQREDPTFRVHVDPESNETIISGMGELHLDVYVERMKREYSVDLEVSEPRVNYRETIGAKAEFNYLHKKQSGGAGQFGRVIGYMEPLDPNGDENFVFENKIVGNAIPPEYINACKKGFEEALAKGALTGHKVEGVRVCLTDGQAHAVDSSELAFKLAAKYAFTQGFNAAKPQVLEPVMGVEVQAPQEFQGTVISLLNKRRAQLQGSDADDMYVTIQADVPLSMMFGFSTDLRSGTQGKGEFTMEYKEHQPVLPDQQAKPATAPPVERRGGGGN
jgi:elongation factor G